MPVHYEVRPAMYLSPRKIQTSQPRHELIEVSSVQIAAVSLKRVANWQQAFGKSDGPTAEIVEVTRKENILPTEVCFYILWAVNAWTLNRASTGVVINAVAQAFRQVRARDVGDAMWPAFTCLFVIILQRKHLPNSHRVDQTAAQIAASRISRANSCNPIAGLCNTSDTRFAYRQSAHSPKGIRGCSIIDANCISE